jgi:hypothetical protein
VFVHPLLHRHVRRGTLTSNEPITTTECERVASWFFTHKRDYGHTRCGAPWPDGWNGLAAMRICQTVVGP